jgi:hypothetical protein
MPQMPQKFQKKLEMIEALEKTGGHIAKSCKIAKIDRKTHYRWMDTDEKYRSAVNEIINIVDDDLLDEAVNKLREHVKSGSIRAVLYVMDTRGHKRGFSKIDQSDEEKPYDGTNIVDEPSDE